MQDHDPGAEFGTSQLLRIVQELAGLGVWSWEVRTNEVTWSDQLYRIHGLEPGELDASFEGWLERVHPGDRDRVRRAAERALRERSTFRIDERIVRPDGSIRVIESHGTVLCDDEGSPLRMVGASRDVTDERALQARLAHQERLSTIGTLAAGVANELNNPLFYVRASLEHLRDALGEIASFEVNELLLDMIEGVDRMSRVIEDLQVPAGRSRGPGGPVGVASVVEAAINMVSHDLRHRARVERDLDHEVHVRADEFQLRQILISLLANAALAIPTGRAYENTVRVEVARQQHEAVITVTDTGAPTPDPLQGLAYSSDGPIQPRGHGAFATHGMVVRLGGSLTIDTLPRGTRATVRLPAAPAPEALPSASPSPRPAAGRRCVLVVDDDLHVGGAFSRLLDGHQVIVVGSAGEALDTLASGLRPDLLICDLMMPDGLGSELFAKIEARWPELAPRVRFVTGGAFAPEIRAFAEANAHLTLRKPFTRRQLLDLLASV